MYMATWLEWSLCCNRINAALLFASMGELLILRSGTSAWLKPSRTSGDARLGSFGCSSSDGDWAGATSAKKADAFWSGFSSRPHTKLPTASTGGIVTEPRQLPVATAAALGIILQPDQYRQPSDTMQYAVKLHVISMFPSPLNGAKAASVHVFAC